MPDPSEKNLRETPGLSHRVRRLRWFCNSFRELADEVGRRYHFAFAVDDRSLVDAFFRWARIFERERVSSDLNREEFAIFAAGLMLRELLRVNPAQKQGEGQFKNLIPEEPMAAICQFWPEGYLYTSYCRNLLKVILETEYDVNLADPPDLYDLRSWHSFKENFRDDPSLATAFFDVFMGVKPNWDFPDSFLSRPRIKDKASAALPKAAQKV